MVSLAKVKNYYRVRYDSEADDGCFMVHQKDRVRKFRESSGGLFYYKMKEEEGDLFVTTVRDRRNNYTKKEYK